MARIWAGPAMAAAGLLAIFVGEARAGLHNVSLSSSPTSRRLQSLFHADLTTWEQYGPPSAGDWAVRQDRIWLDQNINGHPTYYVAPFDVIETTVTGTFGVGSNWDDDYLGFVFGFKPGNTPAAVPKRMILFDWSHRPGNTREGFRLLFVDTESPQSNSGWSMNNYIPWSGTNRAWIAVSPESQVSTQGWKANELYDFKAFYGSTRITIWMRCYARVASCADGVFGSDYRLVYDVASTDPVAYMFQGSFPDGRFGFYDYSQASTRYGRFLILCPLGHYCLAPDLSEENQPNPCPAGTFGDVEGLTSPLCSGNCHPGHFCTEGSVDGSSPDRLCRAGRYGGAGQVDTDCSGPCAAGYYCPAGSSSPQQNECGGDGLYCPEGSGAPVAADPGYYTEGESPSRRSRQDRCPIGHFCTGGQRFPCPAGTFGDAEGLSRAACSGLCRNGFFCPAGSTTNEAQPCGIGATPARYYCPAGAPARLTVQSGEYSTPESAPASQRTGKAACPQGFACKDGEKNPSMFFGSSCPDGATERTVAELQADVPVGAALELALEQGVNATFSIENVTPAGDGPPLFALEQGMPNGVMQLRTGAGGLNFQTSQRHTVLVRATASTGPSDTVDCEITVRVDDVNQPPVFASVAERTVAEGSGLNEEVGAELAADVTDPDFGQALDFTITGGNEEGMFKINSCSGQIFVAKRGLDINAREFYTLSVRVTDDGVPPLSDNTSVVVRVIDRPDPPTLQPAVVEVVENSPAGTNISRLNATDPDPAPVFTFSIVRGSPIFGIHAASGVLFVREARLDYELQQDYALKVRVTDETGLSDDADVTVIVLDANDPPTLEAGAVRYVRENSPAGTPVGDALAVADEDVGQTVSCEMVDTAGGFFTVDAAACRLETTAAAQLDFETRREYTVTVRARDNAGGESPAREVTVLLIDTNDPPFLANRTFAILESADTGTVLGTLVAEDEDASQVHTYDILNPATPPVWTVGIYDGALRLAGSLDYETRQSYTLSVRVRDNGHDPGPMDHTATITINVVDVPEPPVVDPPLLVLPENTTVGTVLAERLRATDPEGKAITFSTRDFSSFESEDADALAVLSVDTGGVITLVAPLDYEAESHYALLFTATDADGNFTSGLAQMLVTNVDEPPVLLPDGAVPPPRSGLAGVAQPSNYSRVVSQNAEQGARIGAPVVALDPEGDAVRFSLHASPRGGAGDLSLVALDPPASGQLVANSALTNRKDPIFVTLRAADPAGHAVETEVVVRVIETNTAPRFNVSGVSLSVPENSAPGTLIGAPLRCSDADDGDVVRFAIAAGNAGDLFAVDAQSGQLSVNEPGLNFEAVSAYTLTMSCTDSGGGTLNELSDTAQVTVQVTDVNEPPTITFSQLSVPEGSPAGYLVGTLTFSDPDADDQGALTLSLEAAAVGGANPFSASPTTGLTSSAHVLVDEDVLDFETGPRLYLLTATVSDGELEASAGVEVTVLNVNERPRLTSAGASPTAFVFSVPEDRALGAVVGRLTAEDPDADTTLTFSRISGGDGVLDVRPGGDVVVAGAGLDWERSVQHQLVVAVTDNGIPFDRTHTLSQNGTATVNVVNVNDATISAVGGQLRSNTTGGAAVTLSGTNLGSVHPPATAVRVFYRQPGHERRAWYEAQACRVTTLNTEVACETAPGVGFGFEWRVEVGDGEGSATAAPPAVAATGYLAPTLDAVVGAAGLATVGGATVRLRGDNLGPAGGRNVTATAVAVSLVGATQPAFTVLDCVVTAEHREVACSTPAGFGASLQWDVVIGGQRSNAVAGGGFAAPSISSVDAGAAVLSTLGGDEVVLAGANFGAVPSQVRVTYGATGREYTAELVENDPLSPAHRGIRCRTVPGVGAGLRWRVTVGGQESSAFATALRYQAPALASVQIAGSDELVTSGGQTVLLRGGSFGPLTPMAGGAGAPVVTYGPTGTEFHATACAVVGGDAQISCSSAPGTGRNHSWVVAVGGQASGLLAAGTRYASPVVLGYAGAGANKASTEGGEEVVISGRHFGTVARSAISRVTYRAAESGDGGGGDGGGGPLLLGMAPAGHGTRHPPLDPGSVVYEATGCRVTKDHVQLTCHTAEGAGANLRWSVFIDGQKSRDPSTAYAAPAVLRFSGAGASGASTEGEETVVIEGTNFGPTGNGSFLDRVTYGPSGSEYVARDCYVSAHDEIRCRTAPSVGRQHRWTVEVGGQVSEPSTAVTSFAAPSIAAVAPAVAPAAGGATLVVNGTNFGLRDGQASLRVLLAGRRLQVVASRILPDGAMSQVEAVLPPGVGSALGLVVETFHASGGGSGAQRSAAATFSYAPPVIQLVTTAEVPGSQNLVEVIVRGANFGPSVDAGGEVRIGPYEGAAPSSMVPVTSEVVEWRDGVVRVLFDGTEGTVQVVAGGQASGGAPFRNINPSLSVEDAPPRIIEGAPSEVGGLPRTEGGATLEIAGKFFNSRVNVTLGGRPCPITGLTLATENSGVSRINCTVPAGEGLRPALVVMRDGTQPSEPEFVLPYQAPRVTATEPESRPTAPGGATRVVVPTAGAAVVLRGDNFGLAPAVVVQRWPAGATEAVPLAQGHGELRVQLPAGQGASLAMTVQVGGQTNQEPLLMGYEPPRVDAVSPAQGPTAGNVTLTLTGANFGVAPPAIRVGSAPCDLLPGHTHTTAQCTLRAGEGASQAVQLEAGAQNSSAGPAAPAFAFLPPAVAAVTPRAGRTAGGENVTIRGANFGLRPAVALMPRGSAAPFGAARQATVLHWSHEEVVVALPEGQGSDLVFVVRAGDQESVRGAPEAAFSYAPPTVSALTPSHGPTDGGFAVVVTGDNFGALEGAAEVAVGDYACAVAAVEHTAITCVMPEGMGADHGVAVTVSGQASAEAVAFSFDPPEVTMLVPNVPDAEGEEVDLRGRNFGTEGTDAVVEVDGLACEGATWARDATYNFEAYIRCRTPRDKAGWKNVTLTVARQTARLLADDRVFRTVCKRGWYGRDGELCLPCPQGATCAGEGADPVAEAGWFDTPLRTPDARCPEERQAREQCPFIVPCEPKEACTGNNTCAAGYAAVRCSECAQGFYRLAGLCEECPQNPLLLIVGFLLGCVLLCAAGWTLHRKQVSVAFFSIGVDYFQVLALFASTRVAWPPVLRQLYQILSAFNFNLELTAPECSLDVTYENKWWFAMALPVGAMAVFVSLYVAKYVQKRCIQRRRNRLHSHLSALVGVALTMFYYLYLYVVRTTLDVFNCSPTDPPDGNEYMEAVFVKCYEPGGLHLRLLPFALVFAVAYGIGYPALMASILWRNQLAVREDQALRARGLGDTRLTNPRGYDLRKRYHKAYYHFKPAYHWWTLAILARKFLVAVAALMFRKNVSFQLAMVLLVLFVSYTLQVKYRPYMSTSEHDAVWQELQRAAELRPHGWEAIVVDNVRRAERKALRKQRTTRMLWNADRQQGAATRAAQASEFVTNYNTVEGTLLFCAVLVCLSGIMFESERFDSDYFAVQREVITWATVLVVVASMAYYFAMLFLEVGTFLAPECVRATRERLSGKGRRGADSDSEGEGEDVGDDEDAAGAAKVELASRTNSGGDALGFNPMFMQDASAADRAAAAKAATGSWDIVRFKSEYDALSARVADLQSANQRLVGDLRAAKKGAALATAGGPARSGATTTARGIGRPKLALRKKKAFEPEARPESVALPGPPLTAGKQAEGGDRGHEDTPGAAGGWLPATDPAGRTYYFNKATGETTWTKPEGM